MCRDNSLYDRAARVARVAALAVLAAVPLAGCAEKGDQAAEAAAAPGDFLVVMNRPNKLNLVDLKQRKVANTCDLPGDFGPGTVAMSPDNRTAYVLTNRFENIYGVDVDTCEIRFSARQSQGDERVKSISSIAVSPDGKEVYTHQNPTRLLIDRYEVQDARIAVFDTSAGLDAKPVRTFPAPRQITIMAVGKDGTLYMGGRDIYAMNMQTGATTVALKSQSLNDPMESQRDSLTVWPLGDINNEMVRMYSAARYKDATQDLATADWVWGFERVDLATGAVESKVFGPLEVVLFSGMARPSDPNQFYGVLTQLKKFDVAARKEVKSVDLDHSYYCINFSTDGSEVYLAGTFNDIAVYNADTLEKLANIQLTGGDMSLANSRVFSRAL
ncbi:MAG: quinohemoprotein amine dehydrogenase subunit beta [Gammaproteobacteria bacterium]|jgi:quinohemoprotein amine dehydrogenase beta subunit|nr:quinohemoprotein amine dehydrogenase subunit beta [Gammaproteobacteria bacterium]